MLYNNIILIKLSIKQSTLVFFISYWRLSFYYDNFIIWISSPILLTSYQYPFQFEMLCGFQACPKSKYFLSVILVWGSFIDVVDQEEILFWNCKDEKYYNMLYSNSCCLWARLGFKLTKKCYDLHKICHITLCTYMINSNQYPICKFLIRPDFNLLIRPD